ncbi:MAG: hypothetical protein HFJ45_04830 [Clostridia bacterium]|nr:hypothetical protein [Clostridia bacterium]
MIDKKIIYIWISKLQIDRKIKLKAIKELGGINEFFEASLDDLIYLEFSENAIYKILNKKTKEECFYDLEYMTKNNIDIIGIFDKEYPLRLRTINENPICFYLKGNSKILNNISVRNCRF